MARAPSARREALRAELLDIAEAEIAKGGIVALKARDLATQAGCALGAIYSVYSDLGELAQAVNRRTLDQMTLELAQAVQGLEEEAPADILITLAQTYAAYARRETRRWQTLFSIGLAQTEAEPGFHDALEPLILLYAAPLSRLNPEKKPRGIERRARATFAAVHGVVSLGMEPRLAALQPEDLDKMLVKLVATLGDREEHF